MITLKEIDERIKMYEKVLKDYVYRSEVSSKRLDETALKYLKEWRADKLETIKKIKRIYQIKTCTDCKNNETGCLNVFYRELLKQLSGTEDKT